MNKTPTPKSEQVETAESTQPSVYDDLLKNGTAILEAPTREALAELVDNIPADCKYAVGAVGRKGDGSAYTLQVDIVKQ
jgi:hypothetical protein